MFTFKGYQFLSIYSPEAKALLALAILWTLVWKGIALWKAGRNGQLPWFVALFILNTLGILDVLYIVWFAKKKA